MKLAKVIKVDFKKKKTGSFNNMNNVINIFTRETVFPQLEIYSLKKAKEFLGPRFWKKALFEWTLEELEQITNHPQAFFTDASDAYEAILIFRKNRAA